MRTLIACGLMLAATSAIANEGRTQQVGLRLGSAGIGLEYGIGVARRVDLRAGYSFGSLSRTVDVDGIDYDARVRAGAAFGLFDLRPFDGGFRVTAGAYSKPPRVDFFTVANNDEYDIGGTRYTANGRLDGDVRMGSVTPYAGIGWGGAATGAGFGWSFDAGVLFAGQPEVALTATGRACNSTLAACNPDSPIFGFDVNGSDARAAQFQSALEQERKNFEKDIENRRYWPVINLGLHYRF
ncbi:hypothetical protein AAG565_14840 [Fontimonas sp. SYSU GA230001]|uniref:hypothetical protein n=1 Tax=Fontimonas sp. SYSU GA230001 TaxID=3142450 RepID=UPI0032B40954